MNTTITIAAIATAASLLFLLRFAVNEIRLLNYWQNECQKARDGVAKKFPKVK